MIKFLSLTTSNEIPFVWVSMRASATKFPNEEVANAWRERVSDAMSVMFVGDGSEWVVVKQSAA